MARIRGFFLDAMEREYRTMAKEPKSWPPIYSILSVSFDDITCVCRIQFLQKTKYRTIERYKTINYRKYPIYSGWKEKNKEIEKSIKLTNAVLEKLPKNSDDLIRNFAREIIQANLKIPRPSWFRKQQLKEELNQALEKNERTKKELEIQCIAVREQYQNQEKACDMQRKHPAAKKEKTERRLIRLCNRLEKAEKNLPGVWTVIFTFGFALLLHSSGRVDSLKGKKQKLEGKIQEISCRLEDIDTRLADAQKVYDEQEKILQQKLHQLADEAEALNREYTLRLQETVPLEEYYHEERGFVPLKQFQSFTYEKIVGCYIIHNIENDRYYIGQSKDVYKRLSQHFNGMVPNNIIFAEDYYSCKNSREDLFAVKIIPLKTKDELDKTERELIARYDAFNSGYNKTAGNK